MAQEGAPGMASTGSNHAPWINLIENAASELAREDDRCIETKWDSRLADLSSTLKSRIPPMVMQRCAAARDRANCGLIASAQHAWATVDCELFIWDYRREDPQVLSVPADSSIITIGVCPPRPGVFESSVHLLIVLCTRLTVSLIGVHLVGGGEAWRNSLVSNSVGPSKVESLMGFPASGHLQSSNSIRLMTLEGYSARVDGAVFNCVRHTADGHILLTCGAPQIYELAYSRTPGWFHSKCRLIPHMGLKSRLLEFLSISSSGRLRILECASNNYSFGAASTNYVFTADDSNTIRLFRVRDQAVHRLESVAVIEELAALTTSELNRQKSELTKSGLSSTVVNHICPTLGLDGTLCAYVVTAQERLFFTFSAPGTSDRTHRFQLRHCSRLPGDSPGTTPWLGVNPVGVGSYAPMTMMPVVSPAAPAPTSSLASAPPCLHAAGVWIMAVQVPGSQHSQLHITARVDTGCGSEAQELSETMRFDRPVLDVIEEFQFIPGSLPEAPLEGEPSAFRGIRSFALLLEDAIQVFSLSFKPKSMSRPPETVAECCLHFVQLSLPPFIPVDISASSESTCYWSFDDARTPSFAEQENCLRNIRSVPELYTGRWFRGLLRFLAIVLRPVWNKPIVRPVWGKQAFDLQFLDTQVVESLRTVRPSTVVGLSLNLTESKVQRLLQRLRPVLQFAKRALIAHPQMDVDGKVSTPVSVASRSRLYSVHRTTDVDCPAQARQLLKGVVDLVDRLQQVLALMGVILAQRSAYRVLQSAVLAGEPLACLLNCPLKLLVSDGDAIAPVGKLCTALIIESGLTTPTAELVFDSSMITRPGSSSLGQQWRDPIDGLATSEKPSWSRDTMSRAAQEVCRELEKQCPIILSLVDLDLCYTRALTEGTAVAAATPGDVLSRCVQCVPSNANEDRWETLTSSIKKLAAEDIRQATEMCVEKLQQLQQSNGDVGRAKVLVETLLSVLTPQPEKQSCAYLEHLLAKTSSIRFGDQSAISSSVPFLHDVILNYVLHSPRLQNLIEVLLDSSSANTEAFLKERCGKSRPASEFLWKYYLKRERPSDASYVLSQIAESPGSDCPLPERVHYLDLARQAAQRCEPKSQDAVEKLSTQLDVATRVQIPLCQELRLLASESRVHSADRAAAERKNEELQVLKGLQELYQVAEEFGLFHLVLLINNISSSTQEQNASALNWVHVFFPRVSPYSKLRGSLEQHRIFPLLFLRQCATFFPQNESASMIPEAQVAHPDDFRERAIRLLQELAGLTKVPSTMWDLRVVGTLLEYCNCIWLRSFESQADAAESQEDVASQDSTEAKLNPCSPKELGIAWVALQVLPGSPFHFTPAYVVQFYAEAMPRLPMWVQDLQGMLPADYGRCRLRSPVEDMRWHLRRVVLIVLHHWTQRVEAALGDKYALDEFQNAWKLVEGVLQDITDTVASARAPSYARSLATQAQQVALHARRLCGHEREAVAPEVAGHEAPTLTRSQSLFDRSFL